MDSLVAQTCREFSVIIVDDASTDKTLDIVHTYEKKLHIQVFANGSHNIPRGRNIGLRAVPQGIAAFVDSDDSADEVWAQTIMDSFRAEPELPLISGEQVVSYRTTFARAIAQNDETMRQLFGGGILQFCTCNCAINRDVLKDYYFNEHFVNGEDLEFAARVEKKHAWKFLPGMKVNHTTRDSLGQYAKQMYKYGMWKLFFSYRLRAFRPVDYVPLMAGVFWLLAGVLQPWLWAGLLLLPLAQTAAAILKTKPAPALWPLMFAAWCTKNVAWSAGIAAGFAQLITSTTLRGVLGHVE